MRMPSNNQQQRQTQAEQRETAFATRAVTGRVFIQWPNDAALAGFTPPKQSSWIQFIWCNVLDVATIPLFFFLFRPTEVVLCVSMR